MTFKDLLIKPELIDALQVQNITQPTQIQCKVAKPVFDGRDMIACSSTGSGKTLAYLLPVLSSVDLAENTLQALVLVPTQELASQVNKQIQLLFDNMHSDAHTLMLIGDGNITRQIESLKIKPVIAVATPSRAAQLIRMKKLKVHNVKTLILDEADKLMDKTYLESIIFIRKSLMKRTQVLLFSASISNKTIKQANIITYNPVIYELSKENKELIPKTIKHIFIISDRRERIETLRKIAKAVNSDKTMIFINTKYDLEESLQKLQYHNYNVAALAGNIDKQSKKKAVEDFQNGRLQYLLATDVAARGLQIDHVSTVINVNLPEEPTEYLHRAGRCGRNNEQGLCISIITENELNKIKKYQKAFNINIVQKRLYNGKIVSK
jgi:superfamily II DNA/RNA helicase